MGSHAGVSPGGHHFVTRIRALALALTIAALIPHPSPRAPAAALISPIAIFAYIERFAVHG